jgi:hypothetical protein
MSFVARRRPIGALKDALAKLAAIVPRSPSERQGEGIAVSLSGYLRQASQLADIRCKIGSRLSTRDHSVQIIKKFWNLPTDDEKSRVSIPD